jgi:WD40 repeat protein
VQSGEEIYRFQGHDADFIFDIAISPDGQSALSCGTDQTIIHWQLTIPSEEELFDWITANRRVRELTCEERALYQIEPLCEE